MKAMVCEAFGGPGVLALREVRIRAHRTRAN